jgi:hypothetical protein
MRIEITHPAGVGMWAYGAVIDIPDRRAQQLIEHGYAAPARPVVKPVKTKKGEE